MYIFGGGKKMDCEGIKIKIERNKYQTAALDFWIFNPETEQYDEKNAFSDENRLLKFTAETRNLDEYASEMLLTMLSTYKRLKKIQLEFYGDLADYDILNNSLTELGSVADCVINPHCDLDPAILRKRINECIKSINDYFAEHEFKDFIKECEKNNVFNKNYTFKNINLIDDNKEGIELINEAKNAIVSLSTVQEEVAKTQKACEEKLETINHHIENIKSDRIIASFFLELYNNDESFSVVYLEPLKEQSVKDKYLEQSFKDIERTIKDIAYFGFEQAKEGLSSILKEIKEKIIKEEEKATFSDKYSLKFSSIEITDFTKEKCEIVSEKLYNANNFYSVIPIIKKSWSDFSKKASKYIEILLNVSIYDDLNSSFTLNPEEFSELFKSKTQGELGLAIHKGYAELPTFNKERMIKGINYNKSTYSFYLHHEFYNFMDKRIDLDYFINTFFRILSSDFIKEFREILDRIINDGTGLQTVSQQKQSFQYLLDNTDMLKKKCQKLKLEIKNLINNAAGDNVITDELFSDLKKNI